MAALRHRISVVNDNPEFLELMADILDGDGDYEVTTFEDSTTSVDDLAASDPELVIVDLLLAGASGWEIVALSRADERLSSIPIIVCSADVAALRDRADDFERIGDIGGRIGLDCWHMADEPIITPVQLQRTQMDVDRELLRDEDLLNEEHLRRMDQVLLRRNLDHARMTSRKLSLELQQYVHLYTPEANELRRRITKYMVMERMIEREMARRHSY
jgi:CheY-like chemotaxis protein